MNLNLHPSRVFTLFRLFLVFLIAGCGSAVEWQESSDMLPSPYLRTPLGYYQGILDFEEGTVTFQPYSSAAEIPAHLLLGRADAEYLGEVVTSPDIAFQNSSTDTIDLNDNNKICFGSAKGTGFGIQNIHESGRPFDNLEFLITMVSPASLNFPTPAVENLGTYTIDFGRLPNGETAYRNWCIENPDGTDGRFVVAVQADLASTVDNYIREINRAILTNGNQVIISGSGFDKGGAPQVRIGSNTVPPGLITAYNNTLIRFTPNTTVDNWSGQVLVRARDGTNIGWASNILAASNYTFQLRHSLTAFSAHVLFYQWQGYAQASSSGCPPNLLMNDSEILFNQTISPSASDYWFKYAEYNGAAAQKFLVVIDQNRNKKPDEGDFRVIDYNNTIDFGSDNVITAAAVDFTGQEITTDCSLASNSRGTGCFAPPCEVDFGAGSGTFGSGTDVSSDTFQIRSIIVGDLDGDQDLDLVVGILGAPNRVYLGSGDGSFQAGANIGTDNLGTYDLALGDLNGDGNLDLVVANSAQVNRRYLGNGNGTFGSGADISSDTQTSTSIALGDLDNDGDLDVVVGNSADPGETNRRYLGDGNGGFDAGADISSAIRETQDIALADLDHDGNLDVITAEMVAGPTGEHLYRYLGNGDGTFGSELSIGTVANDNRALVVGDLNGDGNLDLVAAKEPDSGVGALQYSYLGDGSGGFDGGTVISLDVLTPNDAVLGDFTGDEILDVLFANFNDQCRIYPGIGDGTFDAGSDITTDSYQTNAMATGDFNGDGNLDVVLGNNSAVNRVYLGQ